MSVEKQIKNQPNGRYSDPFRWFKQIMICVINSRYLPHVKYSDLSLELNLSVSFWKACNARDIRFIIAEKFTSNFKFKSERFAKTSFKWRLLLIWIQRIKMFTKRPSYCIISINDTIRTVNNWKIHFRRKDLTFAAMLREWLKTAVSATASRTCLLRPARRRSPNNRSDIYQPSLIRRKLP